MLGSVSERLERCCWLFPIHAQHKFRSHSHRNCLMIVGYFQDSIFDHGIGVQLLFDDKFGSVLICIEKPKVSVGGGEWAWLSPSHSFISPVI